MKRLSCLLVCLALLLPALAVTAFASTSYVFYSYEPVAFYSGDFDFSAVPENTVLYVYDGVLPEGKYTVSLEAVLYSMQMLGVVDDFYFNGTDYEGVVNVQVYYDGEFMYDATAPVVMRVVNGVTLLSLDLSSLYTDNTEFPIVEFVAKFDSSLSNFLSVDILQGVLDYIWVLIPVTLSVLVGYVGIRKGISWLMRILRSA